MLNHRDMLPIGTVVVVKDYMDNHIARVVGYADIDMDWGMNTERNMTRSYVCGTFADEVPTIHAPSEVFHANEHQILQFAKEHKVTL